MINMWGALGINLTISQLTKTEFVFLNKLESYLSTFRTVSPTSFALQCPDPDFLYSNLASLLSQLSHPYPFPHMKLFDHLDYCIFKSVNISHNWCLSSRHLFMLYSCRLLTTCLRMTTIHSETQAHSRKSLRNIIMEMIDLSLHTLPMLSRAC